MSTVPKHAFIISLPLFPKRSSQKYVSSCTKMPSIASTRTTPHASFHISANVAATVLALSLTYHSAQPSISLPHFFPPPTHAASDTPSPPENPNTTVQPPPELPPMPSNLSEDQRKILRRQSVRNTHAAGKISQKFSSARKAAEAGYLDEALTLYDDIIEQSPDFAPAYSNRANIYVSRKRLDDAIRDYSRAIDLAPLDSNAWVIFVNRGCTRLSRGDNPYDALADMNVARQLKGDDEVVLPNRAAVYEVLEKWDSAIRDYQTALKSNEVRPFWVRYGLMLFQRNKPSEAVSILRRVEARYDAADVHAALAAILFEREDVAAAETEWSLVDRPRLYESQQFLKKERQWPPRALEAMDKFRHVKE